MTNKINTENVIAFITGNLRYKLYYSRFKFLIRTHIREQIDFRIKVMAKECYENGECVICGCSTTALQMADKSCDAPCYPPMMNRGDWQNFKVGNLIIHLKTEKHYIDSTRIGNKTFVRESTNGNTYRNGSLKLFKYLGKWNG